MYSIIVVGIMSFLMIGAWSLMQQKQSVQQAVYYEYASVQRSELLHVGAVYGLEFFVKHLLHTEQHTYSVRTAYEHYLFCIDYSEMSEQGTCMRVTVYDRDTSKGAQEYRIIENQGEFRCIPISFF